MHFEIVYVLALSQSSLTLPNLIMQKRWWVIAVKYCYFLYFSVVGKPWLDTRCPSSHSITPPSHLDRGENKMENSLQGDSLIKQKVVCTQAKRERKKVFLFSISHQQAMFGPSQEPGLQHMQPLPQKVNIVNNKCPTSCSFSSFL